MKRLDTIINVHKDDVDKLLSVIEELVENGVLKHNIEIRTEW